MLNSPASPRYYCGHNTFDNRPALIYWAFTSQTEREYAPSESYVGLGGGPRRNPLVPKMAEMESTFERLMATIGLGQLEMALMKGKSPHGRFVRVRWAGFASRGFQPAFLLAIPLWLHAQWR